MKSFLFFRLCLTLVLVSAVDAYAAKPAEKPKAEPAAGELPCKAAILMEATSGDILYEHNAHEALPPASMVKMMVTYVTLKQIKEGHFNLTDVVTTSAFASKVGGSQVYLKQGEQFTLGQLLEAVLIQSANDASVAIAEHIAGTSEAFVELMNAQAKELGMNDTTFHSPHGLPPGKGQEPDLASAYDLATLGRAIIRDFPEALKYTGKDQQGFRDDTFIMRNHNHLVRDFAGCDGLKTGFYAQAGFGVTATASRKGVRVIAALMGCEQRKRRDSEAARLMTLGFTKYKPVKLAAKGEPAPESVRVTKGASSVVTPVTASDVTGYVKAGEEKNVVKKVSLCPGLTAPVPANTPCGHVSYFLGDKEIGRAELIVTEEIPSGGLTQKLWQMIGK